MCYMLYLGSDQELPLIDIPDHYDSVDDNVDWPVRAPRLTIDTLSVDQEAVRQHFREKYVVYAGSYDYCGCGFNEYADFVMNNSEVAKDDLCAFFAQKSKKELELYFTLASAESRVYGMELKDLKDLVNYVDLRLVVSQESRKKLADYVEQNKVTTLVYCYTGDEKLSPERDIEISLAELADPTVPLHEGARLTVRP